MISDADIEKAAKAIGDQNGWGGCSNPCNGGEENPDCECFRYARAVLEAVGYGSKEQNAVAKPNDNWFTNFRRHFGLGYEPSRKYYIGAPKGTDKYSSEQLSGMGLAGAYWEKDE